MLSGSKTTSLFAHRLMELSIFSDFQLQLKYLQCQSELGLLKICRSDV